MRWKRKDGDIITIKQMTNEHLINAILWMCRSEGFVYEEKDGISLTEWVHNMSKELRRRELEDDSVKKGCDTWSHVIRSSNSPLYDEVCLICGGTNSIGDNRLNKPCEGLKL